MTALRGPFVGSLACGEADLDGDELPRSPRSWRMRRALQCSSRFLTAASAPRVSSPIWPGWTPATASEHLAKLVAGEAPGRGAAWEVPLLQAGKLRLAEALETLAALAPPQPAEDVGHPQHTAPIQRARLCYDHLAGTLGVEITDALHRRAGRSCGKIGPSFSPTSGRAAFADLGIDVEALGRRGRRLGRACLDWSERRTIWRDHWAWLSHHGCSS
jgi:hypothetical protein